jgi:hypothetical protein
MFYDLHPRKPKFVTIFISYSVNYPVEILARFPILSTLHDCHKIPCQLWPNPCRHGLTNLFDKASFNRQNKTSRLALDFPQDDMFLILTLVETATDPSSAFFVSRPDRFCVHPDSYSLGIRGIPRCIPIQFIKISDFSFYR